MISAPTIVNEFLSFHVMHTELSISEQDNIVLKKMAKKYG